MLKLTKKNGNNFIFENYFMSELFLNKDFISKEFAPHISFDMVYNVHLVCKTWSGLVNTNMYIKSVISSPPTQEELEEYNFGGGNFKFNSQVQLTITRGRYYLVEKFVVEDEFEKLYFEEIFGVYKPLSELHDLDLTLAGPYSSHVILQTMKPILDLVELSKGLKKKKIFVDLVSFFLMTRWGIKFVNIYSGFRDVFIKKENQWKNTKNLRTYNPMIEEMFDVLKEF